MQSRRLTPSDCFAWQVMEFLSGMKRLAQCGILKYKYMVHWHQSS